MTRTYEFAPGVSTVKPSRISTEKQVQTEIALMLADITKYRQEMFESYDELLEHLASFKDFRVFLPLVCDKNFDVNGLEIKAPRSKLCAYGIFIATQVFNVARYFGNHSSSVDKNRVPPFGNISLTQLGKFVNLDDKQTARMTAKFFLLEMPLGSKSTEFGATSLKRENVSVPLSFNLLPIDKHYLTGLRDVVEYFQIYGIVLPIFHPNNIKVGDKISVNILAAALERGDGKTVAMHIRAFEELPKSKFTRLSNKLRNISTDVLEHLKQRDRLYYYAFLNGFYQVKTQVNP